MSRFFPSRDNTSDDQFFFEVLNAAAWLFYGDLDEHFGDFVARVFDGLEEHASGPPSFGRFGFNSHEQSFTPLASDFAVAYWLFLSELVRLDLAEYGTSPRGAWLTEDGKRFRRIFEEKRASGTLDWSPDPWSM